MLSRMHLLVNISSKFSTHQILGLQNRPLNPCFDKLILNKSLKRDFSAFRTTLSLSGLKVHKTILTCKSLVGYSFVRIGQQVEDWQRAKVGLSIPSKAFVWISDKFKTAVCLRTLLSLMPTSKPFVTVLVTKCALYHLQWVAYPL